MNTAKDWFQRAKKEGFAIGAFNIDTLDIFKAVMVAAAAKKSPVMVEFSPGEVKYFGLRNVVDMVINAREEYKIPILLNLDHGKPVELCMEAIGIGGPSTHSTNSVQASSPSSFYFLGLINGKITVSRTGLFMRTAKRRSERPKPAAGGMPYSSASKKSASNCWASLSPASRSFICSSKRAR